ncbi:MAG: hypothetical protein ACUVTM_03625 [Candidatus Bathyarchaeia archaeon]
MQKRTGENLGYEILPEDVEEITHDTAHSRFEVLDAVQNFIG